MTTPGVYALTVRLRHRVTVPIRRRPLTLESGWYVYVGSAMGGLEGRLRRHLRTRTAKHWHVDHLLSAGSVIDVQPVATTDGDAECRLSAAVGRWPEAEPVPGFGSTDCSCLTHLHRFAARPGGAVWASGVGGDLVDIFAELRTLYADSTRPEHPPFDTLVSCVLSLRTRGAVTRGAATRLLGAYPTVEALASAEPGDVARLIHPVGMWRQKAAHLVVMARDLLTRFGGTVPSAMGDLLSLKGVGRKTANLVRTFAFGLPSICVDIHVHRITNRWGLVRTATPDDTERELREVLPEAHWLEINPLLVAHGNAVCRPRRADCPDCPLRPWCRYPDVCGQAILNERIGVPKPHPFLPLP